MKSMLMMSYLILYSLIFLAGTNTLAMLAYSREGASFYLGRTLPINYKDSIVEKILAALLPALAILVIQMILGLALYKLSIWNVLLFMVTTLIAIVGGITLHIYCDMRYGNVNWNTRQDFQQQSRQNKGTLFVVLGLMVVGLAGMVAGMVLSGFGVKPIVQYAVFWTVEILFASVFAVVGIVLLVGNGAALYDKIGERQFVPRSSKNKNQRKINGLMK